MRRRRISSASSAAWRQTGDGRGAEGVGLLIGFGLDPVEVDKTWHAELPIEWMLESPNATGLFPKACQLIDHGSCSMCSCRRAAASVAATVYGVSGASSAMLRADAGAPGRCGPAISFARLSDAMPHDTIVTTDVGSHKYLFGQFWPSRHPQTFWMSNGLSGMAYGLSAAIGAKLARPDAPVLAAVGDGGFSMNAQELETAERVGAPFITVVLEDGSYSLIKLAQENRKLEPYRMDFGPIDTVKMAESCGVDALRTSNPDELASAVKRAVEGIKAWSSAFPFITATTDSYSKRHAASLRSAQRSDSPFPIASSSRRCASTRATTGSPMTGTSCISAAAPSAAPGW